MSSSRQAIAVAVLWGLAALAVQGCSYTGVLTYAPRPTEPGAVSPRAISVTVLDQRDAGTKIGYVHRGIFSGMLHESRPVPGVFLDALKSGLEADGHKIVSDRAQPDIVVTTRIRQFFAVWVPGAFNMGGPVRAIVDTDVLIREVPERRPPIERRIQFQVDEAIVLSKISVYETALDKGLTSFVDRVRQLVMEMSARS